MSEPATLEADNKLLRARVDKLEATLRRIWERGDRSIRRQVEEALYQGEGERV